jgi:hypothetical protein
MGNVNTNDIEIMGTSGSAVEIYKKISENNYLKLRRYGEAAARETWMSNNLIGGCGNVTRNSRSEGRGIPNDNVLDLSVPTPCTLPRWKVRNFNPFSFISYIVDGICYRYGY